MVFTKVEDPRAPKAPQIAPFAPVTWDTINGPSSPNISGYFQPNWAQINQYQARSPEERAALNSVSGIARLLSGQGASAWNQGQGITGVGSDAYRSAMDYYTNILQGKKGAQNVALAPSMENLAELGRGSKSAIESGNLNTGAKARAIADLNAKIYGAESQTVQNLQPGAAAALSSGGLGGIGAGTGLEQAGTSAETAGAGANMGVAQLGQANRLASFAQDLSNRSLTLSSILKKYDADIAKYSQDIAQEKGKTDVQLRNEDIDLRRQTENIDALQKFIAQQFAYSEAHRQDRLARDKMKVQALEWYGTTMAGGSSSVGAFGA